MPTDHFVGVPVEADSPAVRSDPVTPHDSTELDPIPRALYVGTGGHVVGRLRDDAADRTWKNVPAGTTLSGRFRLVKNTGTTAADLIGMS